MMGMLWAVLFVASTGLHLAQGLPLRPTPQVYPHDHSGPSVYEAWGSGGLYAALPALALVVSAVGLVFGCTWCYRHKDCKPNEGTDNQLFTASATHLHDARRSHPPDSGFSEPVNNNITEDNNNGPISLREMQNIANNNATAYIVSENEERNRISRESVVEFEPLPTIRVADPLERCADWFGGEDLPRDRLQYLREIGRGWFGRVVEGELEDNGTTTVAVKILNQNARLEDKARFLDEARIYRDSSHENVLSYIAKCLQEDPWILIFELCTMDLQQYLVVNRPKMAMLNETGVPLQLMCDVTSALSYLHSRGYLYGNLWSGSVFVRGAPESARAVLGRYAAAPPPHDCVAPETETNRHPPVYTAGSEVWSLGCVLWEVCAWGAPPPRAPPPPALPCPYRNHLYQVMQLCWNPNPEARPTSTQVHALINHLHTTHSRASETSQDDGYGSSDFEERWQRLKPNTIPKVDEHVAIVHAPSTSMSSHFTGSDQDFDNAPTIQDTLSVEMDTAVSRSSSIMSDKDPLSIQIKSESLTNLHGSLEDVRNIYLTHNETAALECHQGNMSLEEAREKEHDRSDSSVDPWLKDIITGSQDDVSYYKDVSDVIKNLDNILNSEKTSSSESSHQASPSRDNLSLECKKDYPMQTSMVKSPGISNFQNILEMGFSSKPEQSGTCEDDEVDRDTVGTLSHSFERHSDSTSQHTLENLTPDTPMKDLDITNNVDQIETKNKEDIVSLVNNEELKLSQQHSELPKDNNLDNSDSEIPKLMELSVALMPSVSETIIQQVNIKEDCQTPCDNNITEIRTEMKEFETKSVDKVGGLKTEQNSPIEPENTVNSVTLPVDDNLGSQKEFNTQNTYIIESSVLPDPKEIDTEIMEPLVNRNLADSLLQESNKVETNSEKPSLKECEDLKETYELSTEPEEKFKEQVPISKDRNTLLNDTIIIEGHNNEMSLQSSTAPFVESEFDSPKLTSNEIDGSYLHKTYVIPDESQLKRVNSNELITETNFLSPSMDADTPSTVEVESKLANDVMKIISDEKNIDNLAGTENISSNDHDIINSPKGNTSNNELSPKVCSLPFETELSNITSELRSEPEQELNLILPPNEVIVSPQEVGDFILNERLHSSETSNSSMCFVKQLEPTTQAPEAVQSVIDNASLIKTPHNETNVDECINILDFEISNTSPAPSPETVQITNKDEVTPILPIKKSSIEDITINDNEFISNRSDIDSKELLETESKEQSNDATANMDLINDTNSDIVKDNNMDNVKDVIQSCLESSSTEEACTFVKNDSTIYLDLPSVIKETDNFLHSEKNHSSQSFDTKDGIYASTPKGSKDSAETTLEESAMEHITEILSETKVPDYGPGVSQTKLEQRCVPDSLSPFESPTKSHHTDTYDENSSVVLGPFENCTLDFFKGAKPSCELVEIPKEELLAFSSNFSEINLETPSPLRDGNFLNEVPDLQYDDTNTLSEAKPVVNEPLTENNSDETEEQSTTEKRVSPLTPPNSPGNFLATVSQQKYLVDIDVSSPSEAPLVLDAVASSSQNEVDLNQIQLQITTKMAMAENENNMNIEYSGPLTEEGLIMEDSDMMHESDAIPESYLAGNGGQVEELREGLMIDEERMKELRNELELKLPLAQVAAIEPSCSAWCELPPPPELVLNYGALSPIAEETGQQLSAYENDDHWNISTRTESSESYPEPCNNSTDDVTDLLTGIQSAQQGSHDHSTYTIHSKEPSLNHTYTVQKEVPSSKEMTMSADSLNASPFKRQITEVRKEEPQSIDDRTFNKTEEVEEKDSNCERISQVSPFLLSPTTETSAPDNSDNVAGMSTLSKTTVPTDAKSSKPSETQCLSKATSIDSWCSNDTLYNVEENFDDLAMDPDVPLDFEQEKDKSESEDTLTHNEDEKELSHCSTYIIHDSKSEVCETFSPDSITANDNYTYTKVKTDAAGATPSVITKSDVNDSTKNTQTKDLAYGTLMSGMPSYSNCTTEVLSGIEDPWKLAQPELVRRSPIGDDFQLSPPKQTEDKDTIVDDSPQLTAEPSIKKMDSVDITCLKDESVASQKSDSQDGKDLLVHISDSPNCQYKNMAPSVTSTPLIELLDGDNVQAIPMQLPEIRTENTEYLMNSIPNFQTFLQSAEVRPQDISSNASNEHSEMLLEGDSKTLSRNSNRDSLVVSERTPTYSDFEDSAITKPQDMQSRERSSQSLESGISSEDFRQFESSVRQRPQDLSSLIDASSLLLKSERMSSDLAMSSLMNVDFDLASPTDNHGSNTDIQAVVVSPPNITNLIESHNVDINRPMNVFITDLDLEDENEQPHSIIITECQMVPSKLSISPNRTYDSHTKGNLIDGSLNYTYDSHSFTSQQPENIRESETLPGKPIVNGIDKIGNHTQSVIEQSVSPKNLDKVEVHSKNEKATTSYENDAIKKPKSPTIESVAVEEDIDTIQCNGKSEKFATVHFLNEAFEELMESNVDDNDSKDSELKDEQTASLEKSHEIQEQCESTDRSLEDKSKLDSMSEPVTDEVHTEDVETTTNGQLEAEDKVTSVTQHFLMNEKNFCQFDAYLPLLSDIRFTGPASEIMSTSFTQDSPTEPTSPECEQDSKPDPATDILKEWDSDSESHSSNSSSGEFIWKGGDGHETAVVPSTHFHHQRDSGSQPSHSQTEGGAADGDAASSAGSGDSGDSGSGSEGDEVEFVPSSWDCRAAPAKSSLRSLEQPPESKKRVVFKRQKYHCVYEYPREVAELDADSPAPYLPDLSTYCEWDPTSVEEAELGYGQLFGAPSPLDLFPLRAGIAFGADYDEDFFISSSARPFETLGVMSSSSQFFPGLHKPPPSPPSPPSPPPALAPALDHPLAHTATPSLDFTTPDSGVEDITPGSTLDDDFKEKKLPDGEPQCWRPLDSASSSESVSPSSPGGEALGGLRHTRDKLKLDLPPSPHVPSPRHSRVFSFVLDKPKRPEPATPLVMSDATPVAGAALPASVPPADDAVMPEPTFSTFGKGLPRHRAQPPEQETKSIILTDEDVENELLALKEESDHVKEPVKGEGTVLDSGDEDSGIESSSKATLERNKPATPNIS
ncbi:uncharacterized protein [Epargyreus clarus]|uniref:uncharacterized protein isoform X2 n=1 Tax=Epargyreus clarus TaxID=520877 RepID=UPI003C2F8075